jgi:hypothetical protein
MYIYKFSEILFIYLDMRDFNYIYIFVLRKLKFILNRNNLNKIYVTYILPLLEYACELWDGCCSRDADKLEQLQFETARIITGLPKFASKESLYFETGCETLSCRRGRRKLTLFHEIHNNIAPEYLQDCLNEYLVVNNYNLRNSLQYGGTKMSFRNIFHIVFSVYYTFMEFIGSEF